jgi:hypothetical protein
MATMAAITITTAQTREAIMKKAEKDINALTKEMLRL